VNEVVERVVEKQARAGNGFLGLGIILLLFAVGAVLVIYAGVNELVIPLIIGVLSMLIGGLLIGGLVAVQPNQARVLTLFGTYVGSLRSAGFWWVNPFTTKKAVSLRVRNFTSERVKVNDADGNPVEIAAVVVWRVAESAKAVFDVDDYEQFVGIQSETALRGLATRYPYDASGADRPSLRENPDELATALRGELEQRLEVAGVDVIEARLTHLAYAPEIAQAMLRRQQAQAVVSARRLIVEAAVGMVEDALNGLSQRGVVELDDDKRAAMANNLMVALTSEQGVTPIVNAGTLYGG